MNGSAATGLSVSSVQPASGTSAPVFTRLDMAGDHYVIPAEAVPYLGTLLDPRLFDVSYLARAGLDDTHSKATPVTVSYKPGHATLPGLQVVKHGAQRSMTLAKSDAAALGTVLATNWKDAHTGRAVPADDSLAGIAQISLAQAASAPPLPTLPEGMGRQAGVQPDAGQGAAPPKYWTLTVNIIGQDGKPGAAVGYVQDLDDPRYAALEADPIWGFPNFSLNGNPGPLRFSVPQGNLNLVFTIVTPDAGAFETVDAALVIKPQVKVTGDTTVTLDARTAVPYSVSPPSGVSTTYRMDQIFFSRSASQGSCKLYGPSMGLLSISDPPRYAAAKISATPTSPVTLGTADFLALTELYPSDFETANAAPDGGPRYFLLFPHAGAIPASLSYQVPQAELETLRDNVFIPAGCVNPSSAPQFQPTIFTSWGEMERMGYETSYDGLPPGEHVDYVYSSDPAQTRWQLTLAPACEYDITDGIVRPVVPGGEVTQSWDESPLAPSPAGGAGMYGTGRTTSPFAVGVSLVPAGRQDDLAFLNLTAGDSDSAHFYGSTLGGNYRATPYVYSTTSYLAFWRNGQLAASSAGLGAQGPTSDWSSLLVADGTILPMLHQAASYKLEWGIGQTYDPQATTDTVWTFSSGPSGGQQVPSSVECGPDPDRACSYLPLLFLTYNLALNPSSQARAGTPFQIDFTASHQQGEPVPSGVSANVSASFDGGKTWTTAVPATAQGGNRFTTTISQPAMADTDGYVALRIQAADSAGNTVTQTIIRAYQLTS